MDIYFLTTQYDLCLQLATELEAEGQNCRVFCDSEEFYARVLVSGPQKIDVLAIDFKTLGEFPFFQNPFNPYTFLQNHNCVIPVVFYNDPFPEPDDMAFYWKVQNEQLYRGVLKEGSCEALLPVLLMLQNLVHSERYNPYISLVCKPLSWNSADNRTCIDLEQIRLRHHIAPLHFKLLSFFVHHAEQSLSESELCKFLWPDAHRSRRDSLYSCIYHVRGILKQVEQNSVSIIREGRGCYRLHCTRPRHFPDPRHGAESFLRHRPKCPFAFSSSLQGI